MQNVAKPTRRRVAFAFAALLAMTGVSACGDDGDGAWEAWIKAADASCHRLQTSAGGQPPEDAADALANARFWGALATGARVNLSEIDALPAPSGDEDVVANIVTGMRDTMSQLDLAVVSYQAGNVTKANTQLEEFFDRNEQTVALFTAYGSKTCGEA